MTLPLSKGSLNWIVASNQNSNLKSHGAAKPVARALNIVTIVNCIGTVVIYDCSIIPILWKLVSQNRATCIKHLWKKTGVLSCHRCLINTGVE